MKYFVFSDIHGFYSILKEELDKKGFDVNDENHMLISIGDNFDRGKENYHMFKFLKEMKQKNKIILIKGNHEDLFMDMLKRGYPEMMDYSNKTYDNLSVNMRFPRSMSIGKNDKTTQTIVFPKVYVYWQKR